MGSAPWPCFQRFTLKVWCFLTVKVWCEKLTRPKIKDIGESMMMMVMVMMMMMMMMLMMMMMMVVMMMMMMVMMVMMVMVMMIRMTYISFHIHPCVFGHNFQPWIDRNVKPPSKRELDSRHLTTTQGPPPIRWHSWIGETTWVPYIVLTKGYNDPTTHEMGKKRETVCL